MIPSTREKLSTVDNDNNMESGNIMLGHHYNIEL